MWILLNTNEGGTISQHSTEASAKDAEGVFRANQAAASIAAWNESETHLPYVAVMVVEVADDFEGYWAKGCGPEGAEHREESYGARV